MSALPPDFVDALNIRDLNPGVTIGRATDLLEQAVDATFALDERLRSEPLYTDKIVALETAVAHWRKNTAEVLLNAFSSKAHSLRFATSIDVARYHPPILNLHNGLMLGARCLTDVRQLHLDQRERIAVAAYDLQREIARHAELVALLRDNTGMVEDLWVKLKVDAFTRPPLARLAGFGIVENAIWDLLKAAFGVALVVL